MAAGSYERKSFTGGAQPTALDAGIGGTPSSFVVTTGEGASYPTGNDGPFVVVIGRNTATEEKILVASRVNDQFNIETRGYDDTSAVDHDPGEVVEHVLDASTVDQANNYVNLQTAKGDIIGHDGTNAVVQTVGSDGDILSADSTASTGVAWSGRLTTAESDITTLESNMSTAQSDITSVQSDITSAQSDITSLDSRVTTLESVPYATLSIAAMTSTANYTSGYVLNWGSVSGGAVTVSSDPNNLIDTVGTRSFTMNDRGNVWIRVISGGTLSVTSNIGFDQTDWNSTESSLQVAESNINQYQFTSTPYLQNTYPYRTHDFLDLAQTVDLRIGNSGADVWGAVVSGGVGPPAQTLTLTSTTCEIRVYQTSVIP